MEAAKVNEGHFDTYGAWMKSLGASQKTIHGHRICLKQAFKWGARVKLIPSNPFDHISLQDPAPTPQPCFTDEQVSSLLDLADSHMKPIIACLAFTGLRLGELRDLRWEDVILGSGGTDQIVVRHGGSGTQTKTGKVRHIPIHPDLRPYLESLPRKAPTVFTRAPSSQDPQGINPINQRKVLEKVKAMCKKLKFPGHERMKVHTFRHFFCSMLAKEGAPERYVRGLLGHSSSDIVDLYFTMYDPEARRVIGKIQLPSAKKAKAK